MIEVNTKQLKELKHKEDTIGLFFYTPLCGTCKLAQQMMEHIEKIYGDSIFYKANINQMPDIAWNEKIESVPCLKIFEHGKNIKTVYAFQSVPSLLQRLHPVLKPLVEDLRE